MRMRQRIFPDLIPVDNQPVFTKQQFFNERDNPGNHPDHVFTSRFKSCNRSCCIQTPHGINTGPKLSGFFLRIFAPATKSKILRHKGWCNTDDQEKWQHVAPHLFSWDLHFRTLNNVTSVMGVTCSVSDPDSIGSANPDPDCYPDLSLGRQKWPTKKETK
jgi:hypothetical protein